MIKVSFRCSHGAVTVEGETMKAVIRDFAHAQDVFLCADKCGACQSESIYFRHRTVDGNEFFDLHCVSCGASFNFGQFKDGSGIFPKHENGWKRYGKGEPMPDPKAWSRTPGSER